LSYLVTLDDYSMTDVSNLVHIVDVIELQPGRTTNTKERLGAPGSIIVRDHINTRQVRVQFAILTSDPVARAAALSSLSAWAMDGKYLKIGDRPGQQLRVVCTDTPLTMSKRKWTELCEMTFTAFSTPFWEDVTPIEVTKKGLTAETLTIFPPGNVWQVPLRCRVTPVEETLTQFGINAYGATMVFSGLAVPAGKTLVIDYEDGLLSAKWTADDGTVVPCLRYRAGAEYIPLTTRKTNEVIVMADAVSDVTLSVKGWYW